MVANMEEVTELKLRRSLLEFQTNVYVLQVAIESGEVPIDANLKETLIMFLAAAHEQSGLIQTIMEEEKKWRESTYILGIALIFFVGVFLLW